VLYTYAGNQNIDGTPEMAVPWFRILVGGLIKQMPAFAPSETYGEKSGTEQGVSASTSVSPA